MGDPVIDPAQNPFAAFSDLMLQLLERIRGAPEESLMDLLGAISMTFAARSGNRNHEEALIFGPDFSVLANTRYGVDWEFDFDEVDSGLRLGNVKRRAMGMMHTVCSRLEIERVSLETSAVNNGALLTLPLTSTYRIACTGAGAAAIHQLDHHPYHRLATGIEQSYLMLYGYIVHADGTLSAVAQSDVQSPLFLRNVLDHGLVHGADPGSHLVLVMVEWVFTHPGNNFEPFEVANIARCYPAVAYWSDKPVDRFHCDIAVERPELSDMGMGHDNGRLVCSYYTDRNYEEALSEIDIGVPTWDKLFDHYHLEGNTISPFAAIADVPERTNTTARVIRKEEDDTLQTETTPVKKLARQGRFDNVHMAPRMTLGPGTPVYMAPVCHHDCLHLHWRWSSGYHSVHTRGWSPEWPASGGPNTTPGAPLIPPNQTLIIEALAGAPGVRYRATAEKVDFGSRRPSERWHPFFHHGFGYLVDLRFSGSAIGEWLGQANVASMYHGLRWLELDDDQEVTYVDETRFSQLEGM